MSRVNLVSLTAAVALAGLVLTAVSFVFPARSLAQVDAGPVGVWLDHTQRGAVEIQNCGSQLCGRIVWLQDATDDKSGQPLTDKLNPEPAKRNQPICGLQIIGDLSKKRDGIWDDGWIYDPEKGEKYDLELRLLNRDTLQITGYAGVKFLSETYKWTRAPRDLPRCTA
jgi:uncharacterized protein (DUF2147 family)